MWNIGYWIIQNEEELNQVCESLDSRAESIVEGDNALRNNWLNRNNC